VNKPGQHAIPSIARCFIASDRDDNDGDDNNGDDNDGDDVDEEEEEEEEDERWRKDGGKMEMEMEIAFK
jgi:hypothetical protein